MKKRFVVEFSADRFGDSPLNLPAEVASALDTYDVVVTVSAETKSEAKNLAEKFFASWISWQPFVSSVWEEPELERGKKCEVCTPRPIPYEHTTGDFSNSECVHCGSTPQDHGEFCWEK